MSNATLTIEQLFERFVDTNANTISYSEFWVQSARVYTYVEPANHASDIEKINLSNLNCMNEVNVLVTSGNISHSFVFGLMINVPFESLIGRKAITLHDLNPSICLRAHSDIVQGYCGYVLSDDKDIQTRIDQLLKCKYPDHSHYVDSATQADTQELMLRCASASQLSRQLKIDMASGTTTELMETMLDLANTGLNELVKGITSITRALPLRASATAYA